MLHIAALKHLLPFVVIYIPLAVVLICFACVSQWRVVRRVDLRWRRKPEELHELTALQVRHASVCLLCSGKLFTSQLPSNHLSQVASLEAGMCCNKYCSVMRVNLPSHV